MPKTVKNVAWHVVRIPTAPLASHEQKGGLFAFGIRIRPLKAGSIVFRRAHTGCKPGDGDGGGSRWPGDSVMLGSDSTVMPSAAEAAAAVPRVEVSEVCTAAGVVEAGTTMVAVMSTLAAVTLMVTSEASTPAASAIFCRRLVVSA